MKLIVSASGIYNTFFFLLKEERNDGERKKWHKHVFFKDVLYVPTAKFMLLMLMISIEDDGNVLLMSIDNKG